MNYTAPLPPQDPFATEALRLEAVTVSAYFDDLLDHAITANHPHLDTLIVVTAHDDRRTQQVCAKHGCICVPTDLLKKNGRQFNKGAAINAGFNRFQYNGWRVHLDADILLPDNARRLLFNHTHLERDCIYGCDRIDVVGRSEIEAVRTHRQHNWGFLVYPTHRAPITARYVDGLHGYVPIGFFQLWHASKQSMYPFTLGSAAHDDVCFATLWPAGKRRHLPQLICHHMVTEKDAIFGNNWEGRKQKRLT